jgi:hypothetical protein
MEQIIEKIILGHIHDSVAFFLKGQLCASLLPTCLQDLHIQGLLCFFSIMSFDFWPGLVHLHLPTYLT